MKAKAVVAAAVVAALSCGIAYADKAAPLGTLAKMPIKEVTVFKDGHAFVLHSGKMPTDPAGNIVMDYLPASILGTFWPYASDPNAKLVGVTASQRKVLVSRTALNVRDLIEANPGAVVTITEMPLSTGRDREPAPVSYQATIVGVPAQSGEELDETSPPNSGEHLPVKGAVVMLKTDQGTRVVPFERIVGVTFRDAPKPALASEEFRNLMTLKLEWAGGKAQKDAEVGMVYLQKGVRWIPEYKLNIDGKGKATVRLQATILNELADMDDVTANLVVGVPTFAFKDTLDPMSLQQQAAQLSTYFRQDAQTAYAFSNAIMSQAPRMTEVRAPQAPEGAGGPNLGPEIPGSAKGEDLYIFTVKHISLKKGQRMAVPIAEYSLDYKDVYVLDIPFTPPPEMRRNFDSGRQAEIARLFTAPKVMHKLRLVNKGEYPLTTAPAMIVQNGRVIAQGMMTYAAVGSATDLDLTTAVNVRVKKTDVEKQRVPNAAVWQGSTFARTDLTGKIALTNYSAQPIEVEVVRNVLGNVTEASDGGKAEMVNVFEDSSFAAAGSYPTWWGWYAWPYWWNHFNGIGRVTWNLKLDPGKPVEVNYEWNYYWQ